MQRPNGKLTLTQTDELILKAAKAEDGAIEDCEESADKVVYFFSTGAMGTVQRNSGATDLPKMEKPATSEVATPNSESIPQEVPQVGLVN